MKQSGLNSEHERPEISKHARIRLIQQNKKLQIEIQKLEVILNGVIEKSASNDFDSMEEGQELKKKYNRNHNQQLREINRLKQEIKSIKASLAEHKYKEIKDEENQVAFLRKEHDKLASEKHTLLQKKNEKESALVYYQPINNQTSETFQQYKKIKAQNSELKSKIHQLEREVNKYHKFKQLSKTSVPRKSQNPDYQFLKIENEIKNMRKEMKRIEDKWKGKIQSLDREYFGFKSILSDKETIIEKLEREVKTYQNRQYSFRDENLVVKDRQRIGSLIISPQKKKQMEDILLQLSTKSKRLQQKEIKSKTKKEREKRLKVSEQTTSTHDMPIIIEKVEEKRPESQHIAVPVEVPDQKSAESIKELPPKPTKIMESVGVGTSFYYEGD